MTATVTQDLFSFVPQEVGELKNPQTDLPRIARDPKLTVLIESALRAVPTSHGLYLKDARDLPFLTTESVHLVVTSPPYWTLKEYRLADGQLGFIGDYEEF